MIVLLWDFSLSTLLWLQIMSLLLHLTRCYLQLHLRKTKRNLILRILLYTDKQRIIGTPVPFPDRTSIYNVLLRAACVAQKVRGGLRSLEGNKHWAWLDAQKNRARYRFIRPTVPWTKGDRGEFRQIFFLRTLVTFVVRLFLAVLPYAEIRHSFNNYTGLKKQNFLWNLILR